MAHIIYLLIIAFLIFVIIKVALRSIDFRKKYETLGTEHIQLMADHAALDQGFTEVTDAYASDDAQWAETRQELDLQISELQTKYEAEKDKSQRLYNQGLNNQMAVSYMQEELGTLNRKKLELQEIVDKHNTECLPLISTVREITLDMENFVKDLPPEDVE